MGKVKFMNLATVGNHGSTTNTIDTPSPNVCRGKS